MRQLNINKRQLRIGLAGFVLILCIIFIFVALSGTDEKIPDRASTIGVAEDPNVDEDQLIKMFDRADEQIRSGIPGEAVITIKEALSISPDQPVGHLLLGHALFLSGQRPKAMKEYRKALSKDSDLAQDVRLGEHLKKALSISATQTEAAKLLVEFGSDKETEWLASRANSALVKGHERRAAREALVAAKKGDSIDWVTSLTADFNEFKSCKMRKVVIAQMEMSGNPGFLPLLKANLPSKQSQKKKKKKSLIGQIKDSFRKSGRGKDKAASCIEADLKRAIETLTAIKEGS